MISLKCANLLNSACSNCLQRSIQTSSQLLLIQKWRQERGLPLNPNRDGELTNGADFSYLDGRLTPYGIGQKNRILRSNQDLTDIIKLTGEIDFAVERHKKLLEDEENYKKAILDKKLKAKGINLLKKKK